VVGLDLRLAEHGLAHRAGAIGEARLHVALAAERLDHLDADDRLVGGLRDVALALLDLARDRRHEPAEAPGDDPDERERDRAEQRQLEVREREHDARSDHHHRALRALDQAPADEVADREEVVRRARDDLSRGVVVVEAAREAQVRAEEQLAHAGLDAHADARRRVAALEVHERADGRDRRDRGEQRPQRLLVMDDRAVDRPGDEQRDGEREQRVDEGEDQPERAQAPLLAAHAHEPRDRVAHAQVGRIEAVGGRRPHAKDDGRRRGFEPAGTGVRGERRAR
jgi:hypothetical protein